MTVLMNAVMNNDLKECTSILQGVTDINSPLEKGGDTALNLAVHLNHTKIVELLLLNDADPRIRSNLTGQNSLEIAIYHGYMDIATLIWQYKRVMYHKLDLGLRFILKSSHVYLGHNGDSKLSHQFWPIRQDVSRIEKSNRICFFIEYPEHNFWKFLGCNFIHRLKNVHVQEHQVYDIFSGHLANLVFEYVGLEGLNRVDLKSELEYFKHKCPELELQRKKGLDLIDHLDNKRVDEAERILSGDEGSFDINMRDYRGRTPLVVVIQQNLINMINPLLSIDGIDINARCNNGDTALMHAIELGNRSIVESLLSCHADINSHDEKGWNATMMSIYASDFDILKSLNLRGAKMDIVYDDDYTALSFASECKESFIVKFLVLIQSTTNLIDLKLTQEYKKYKNMINSFLGFYYDFTRKISLENRSDDVTCIEFFFKFYDETSCPLSCDANLIPRLPELVEAIRDSREAKKVMIES